MYNFSLNVYSSDGYLAKKLDVTTGKAVNYEYDSLGRLIHSYQTDGDTVNYRTEHLYDTENRLKRFTYSIPGALGSATGTTTMRPETFYTTPQGGSTKLIGFQYAYDKGGNITKVTNQVDKTHWDYAYDSQNQMTCAVEYQANGAEKKRYQYTYDTYGNIRSVSGAASHTYTYGDSNWLDLLTAFDGQSITYDAIGNPLSYYNGSRYTMTWQNGRQLASTTVGGKTYSYEYGADGIRTRKTNFDGGYTEYYVIEGLAVAEQRFTANGTPRYILRYLYDESNSPIGFGTYYPTASSPYWQYYYFGKNLQGDVVALYRCDYKSSDRSYY